VVGRAVGASVKRVEDPRILSGRGRYVDDLVLPRMVHAAFVRSPMPHAVITSIDTTAAKAVPGVLAVLTADDLATVTQPMQVFGPEGYPTVPFGPLASGKVRFVGDPVVLVVATSRGVAEDAGELVEVEYEPLAPVASMDDAAAANAPVWDEVPDNVFFRDGASYGDPDAAFAEADRVVSVTFDQHRHANVPMEGHALIADFDGARGELTIHASHQVPHVLRMNVASLLGHPINRTIVLTADIGGAFGQKGTVTREEVAVCAASKVLGRPVKWIEDRVENLVAGGQARDEQLSLEAAVRADGELLALRVSMRLDQGAYPVLPLASSLYPTMVRTLLPGPYKLAHYAFEGTVLATNKAGYVAYRGPWAVETFVRERLFDVIAAELGLDPVDVRRRNTLRTEDQPTNLVTGPTIEGVTADQTLEAVVEAAGYAAFRAEQERARAEGRYLGIGISTYMEPAPGPADYGPTIGFAVPPERASVRVEPDGNVTVITSQSPHGQGHETTLAQVAADELGVPYEQVKVVVGDTRTTPFSLIGTGGSRAATMASGAVIGAAQTVRAQVLDAAANLLEASPADLVLEDGQVSVRGTPAVAVPLAQVAMMAYMMPGMVVPEGGDPGLQATMDFNNPRGGWAQASHCCQVEVDLRTGQVQILRYVVAEDCGTLINPAIVAGQVRGGVAQGIGAVLYEHSAYDDQANYVASTFMDYLVPTSAEIPPIEIVHLETPPIADVNFRGVGEGGAIGAPAAVVNAIADALAPFGARVTEQHLPPTRILELAGILEPA
jgi:carbon-monoxide dehydrogenase large subunit